MIDGFNDAKASKEGTARILEAMKNRLRKDPMLKEIMEKKDYLIKKSH